MTNPRQKNGAARRSLRRRVAAMGLPCALCGQPINYDLPPLDPMSYELDEIIPVSLGGNPLDPDNVQPAHRICNQRKSNKVWPRAPTGVPQDPDACSQKW